MPRADSDISSAEHYARRAKMTNGSADDVARTLQYLVEAVEDINRRLKRIEAKVR